MATRLIFVGGGLGDLDGEGVGVVVAVGAGFGNRLAIGQGFKIALTKGDGVGMGAGASNGLTTVRRGGYIGQQDGYVVGVARVIRGGDGKTVRPTIATRAFVPIGAVGVITSDLCDEQGHQTHSPGNVNEKLLAFHDSPY